MNREHLRNPADMPLVTLDPNALMLMREAKTEAEAVRELLDMNRIRLFVINVPLSNGLQAFPRNTACLFRHDLLDCVV